jgi:hypothetical protein
MPDLAKTNHAACADMPPYKGSAAFERMKTLVGKWSGESPEMGTMNTEFRLIAGDSVIRGTFAGGTPMEMLSVYHDVNGKLTMTHYCMLRNQPRMKLVKSTADSLTFDLAPTPGLNPRRTCTCTARPTPSSTRTTSSSKACPGKMAKALPAVRR